MKILYAAPDIPLMPAGPPRMVHLGTLGATASREGLRRFLDVVWPAVCARRKTPPELWIIGSTEEAPPALHKRLDEVGAICLTLSSSC